MIGKSTNGATQGASGVQRRGNGQSAQTVEPPVVLLLPREADVLARIVERRVQRGGGRADEVRAFAVREVLAAGLLAAARAEGIDP